VEGCIVNLLRVLVGLILAFSLGACDESIANKTPRNQPLTKPQVLAKAVGSEPKGVIAQDYETAAAFMELTWEWNRAVAPIVRDYLDPNVSAEAWVKSSTAPMGQLRAVHVQMTAAVLGIKDDQLRNVFQEFCENYRSKLDAMTALQNTVARGDEAGEEQAKVVLAEASARGTELATSFLERLRPYVDEKELADVLRKRGKEIGDLMKPQ